MTGKRKRSRKYGNDDSQPLVKKQCVPPKALPDGVHHYESIEEVPWDIQKYWHQGYSIFSKYDDGVWMTDEAWYGVTHESVADKIAEHIAAAKPPERSIIIDVMCGVGGNAIAFAKSGKWKRVYAIEKDPATLACARHNAEIYGVAEKITFFQGDCFELLGVGENKDNAVQVLETVIGRYGVIFASPPWGGPAYTNDDVFDLDLMQPYGLNQLYEKLSKITPNMALYLPRNGDLNHIGACVEDWKRKKAQVIHYCTNGTSRALCAYLGDWDNVQ